MRLFFKANDAEDNVPNDIADRNLEEQLREIPNVAEVGVEFEDNHDQIAEIYNNVDEEYNKEGSSDNEGSVDALPGDQLGQRRLIENQEVYIYFQNL